MRNRGHDIFMRSAEGRRYQNGIVLRAGGYLPSERLRPYFPWGYSYYPYYAPAYDAAFVYYSPYSFYFGIGPAYIYRRHCYYYPPPSVYIDVPVYVDDRARGYDSELDDYYLSRNDYRYDSDDPDLRRAVDDIREAFRFGDMDTLVQRTDPNVKIAVFREGKYEYSLSPDDYLDMTRDALRSMETVEFQLGRVHRRSEGVWVASGQHVYRDRDGDEHTVYVSFVLERHYGKWVLTQVGTAPERIRD